MFCDLIAHFFLPVTNFPLLVCTTWMSSSIEGHLSCFQVLAIMKKADINISVQVHEWTCVFSSLGCIPRSTIAGSYGKSVSSFVRSRQTVLQSGHTIFHSHQQWMRVLLLHILSHVWCCLYFRFSHFSRRAGWYLIVLYICNFLTIGCWASF